MRNKTEACAHLTPPHPSHGRRKILRLYKADAVIILNKTTRHFTLVTKVETQNLALLSQQFC